MSIRFPDGKDKLLVFEITMKPDEGIYRWATCSNLLFTIHRSKIPLLVAVPLKYAVTSASPDRLGAHCSCLCL